MTVRRRIFHYIVFVVVVVSPGCGGVRGGDVAEPMSNPGLETIPYYSRNTFAFDTKSALNALKKDKERAEQAQVEFAEEIGKRFGKKDEGTEESTGLGLSVESGFVSAEAGSEDPTVPPRIIKKLELPQALRNLPLDPFGYPDWSKAIDRGMIKPRGTLLKGAVEEDKAFDQNIVFVINDRLMADVKFSHNAHTVWLSCKNCHPSIFKDKKGANEFNMNDIWEGRYCGRCHGTVAFQAKGFENCQRCHTVRKGRRR